MEYLKPVLETQISSLSFCMRLADYCAEKILIDVGANMGAITYMLAPFADKVITIEPNDRMVSLIKIQCEEQQIMDKVTIFECAAAENSGEIDMYFSLSNSPLSSVFEKNLSDGPYSDRKYEKKRVKSIAIDDLNLSNVGAMKIDVEGFEGNVIRGAFKTIERCRPAILWERSVGLPETTNDTVEKLLDELGYKHIVVNELKNIHDDVLSLPE